ncbi:MAG TPA: hypothetical protein VNO19_01060 [Gemmatimonadales bacterium]|nr:hypothetical protein [Gemmatimonadales bacterium]
MEVRADPFGAGPYIRVQATIGLINSDALRVGRRALLVGAIAWLPLLLLSAIEGLALRQDPRESMLLDIAAHARYLIGLPLLVIAEAVCLPGLASIARHFGDMGLIPQANRARYVHLVESTRRLLASPWTDISILLLAYAATLGLAPRLYPESVSTWVAPLSGAGHQLSLAGWWRALVSQPLYLMFLIGWLWRVVLWARFLRAMSRLDLQLIPAHPDLAGGLGFVGTSIRAFLLLALALSVPVAGTVAQGILFGGRSLPDFTYVIAGIVIVEMVLFIGPLFLLGPALLRARTRGIFQYGSLAEAVGQQFERRWLKSGSGVTAEALSAPDFSATTDLYSIAANAHGMGLIPLKIVQVVPLVIAVLLPFVPVVLVALPLEEILSYAAKLVL